MATRPDQPTKGATGGKPGGPPTGSVIPPATNAPSPQNPPTEREHPGQTAATDIPPPAAAKRDTGDAPNKASGAADGNRSTASHQAGLPEELRADQDGDGNPDPEAGDVSGQRRRQRAGTADAEEGEEGDDDDEAAGAGTRTTQERLPARTTPTAPRGAASRQTVPTVPTVPTLPAGQPGGAESPPGPMVHPAVQASRDRAEQARAAAAERKGKSAEVNPVADYWRLVAGDAGTGPAHRTANVLVGARPAILSGANRTEDDFRRDVQAAQQRAQLRADASKGGALESEREELKGRAEADAIGGPRQSARLERLRQLDGEIHRLKNARKTLVDTCPRDDLQARRRELLKQIHELDGVSVREGVDDDEADRRTDDLRAELAELEDEMAAV